MDEDRAKKAIRHDILDNIDEIVNRIYEFMGDDVMFVDEDGFSREVDETIGDIFFILGELEEKNSIPHEIDKFLGKEDIPKPITKADGTIEVYNEIDVNGICDKIKFANEIFKTTYRYAYKKGDGYESLPEPMKKILELYLIYEQLPENDELQLKNIRSVLISVALVGAIRYRQKANSPYLLDSEIEQIGKRFMKNLECLHDILGGVKYMSDPKDNGLAIWDTESTFSSKQLKFSRKK